MTVDKLPSLTLPELGAICDASRPVLSYDWNAEGSHRAASHAHPRAHIIQPLRGAYWVITESGTWLVPEGLAIWVPPNLFHEVYSHGTVTARILFVDPAYADTLPTHAGTVKVNKMLDALLERAVAYGNDYEPDGPAARLALVMLDELSVMEFAPISVPISKDPRLGRVIEYFIADPQSPRAFDELAKEAGASPRTLARLFRKQTGMTFSQWRSNLRLSTALERLERGESVTCVALDLGYASTSSFVYAFRRRLGVSPGRYRPK